MLANVYTSLSGAISQEKTLDIIANNLANVSTIGFKGESVSFELLEPEPYKHYEDPLPPANFKIALDDIFPLHGNEIKYVSVSDVHSDYSQGSAIQTQNPMDLMIDGKGFFSVNTPSGVRYTRAGDFSISADGALTDKQGNPLIGQKGNIFLRGNNMSVNAIGEIYVDGEYVDRFVIKEFSDTRQLERIGTNQFDFRGKDEEAKQNTFPQVKQGYLEASNVNAIKNLTDMILTHRSYEAYQKAIKNFDTMMEKSSNTLGELRG